MNNNATFTTITGRIGKTPVFHTRNTKKGACPVAKFSLAVKSMAQGKRETVWVQVSAWDKRTEACKKLQKGDAVQINGFLGTETWINKKGEQVVDNTMNAMFIEFLGRPQAKAEGEAAKPAENAAPKQASFNGPLY
jgi:single-stranded DNA-binding protein